ncbi:MAG: hypothetical protein FWE08_03155 [Oscillospiraceae bacterium]|nr:hypothetical protein [Oscillospiraceae bacterium]
MLELFKGTKYGYYICAILGAFGIYLIMPLRSNYPARLILFFLLLALWVVIVVMVFNELAKRKACKIDRRFWNDCDAENYVAIYEKFSQKRLNKVVKTYVLLNLSAGYLAIGNSTEALRVLSAIKDFPKRKHKDMYEFVYHNNYCSYHLQTNDIPAATQSLAQMENSLQNHPLPDSVWEKYWDVYSEKRCLLHMANGNYDGSEQVFDLVYQKGESTLHRVSAKYTLAKIYLHYDRTAEAKEALEYVIEHGGTTRYKKQAIQLLEEMTF